jgi:hypothetical protein
VPSKSIKQARTMRAAAHNPKFAKKVGIPQSVARKFEAADKAETSTKAEKREKGKRRGKYGG